MSPPQPYQAVTNTATVTSASVDTDLSNNLASDPTTVLASNLSTSTKSVIDLNGGDADPGDTLRYTIRVNETGGVDAGGVTVTDDIPPFIDSYSFVVVPPGSLDNSTGPGTGANGNGFVDIQSIAVATGTSVDIVFDATHRGGREPGRHHPECGKRIANPDGPGAAPAAPDVIVSASAIPGGGTKTLYLYDTSTADPNGFNQGTAPWLSRTPPPTPQADVRTSNSGPPVSWTLTPAISAPLTVDAGSIPVTLFAARNGRGGVRRLQVQLSTIGAVSGPLGPPNTQQFTAPTPPWRNGGCLQRTAGDSDNTACGNADRSDSDECVTRRRAASCGFRSANIWRREFAYRLARAHCHQCGFRTEFRRTVPRRYGTDLLPTWSVPLHFVQA